MVRPLPATLALLLALATPAHSALDATERRIVAAVDRRVPAGLALLERVVNVNSGTQNLAGVREVGARFRAPLEALGFTTRWVDGGAWGRAGHLVAERRGRAGAPRMLLIGHLDTVFEPASPFQRWGRVDEGHVRGPGVSDMKGGDVVMLVALGALRDAGRLDRLDVTVYLGGDEESPGSPLDSVRATLREIAARCDVAIGFEDGDGDPRTAVIARRGSGGWSLVTTGHAAHSSQIFTGSVGSGAVFEAARILAAFHDSLSREPNLTFSPGLVLGGTTAALDPGGASGRAAGKSNVVADTCVVEGDLRALSLEQRAAAQATMRRIVARHLPGTGATIAFDDGYPPLAPSDGNRRLLAMYDAASRDVGAGPVTAVNPRDAGAADVSFTAGLTPMALDGIGLMGSGGHTVHETADLRTFASQAKRAAVLLSRIADAP